MALELVPGHRPATEGGGCWVGEGSPHLMTSVLLGKLLKILFPKENKKKPRQYD